MNLKDFGELINEHTLDGIDLTDTAYCARIDHLDGFGAVLTICINEDSDAEIHLDDERIKQLRDFLNLFLESGEEEIV